MKAFRNLTISQIKLFIRNRQALFWTMFFPIILIGAFGTFINNGSTTTIRIGIVDSDQSTTSAQFIEQLTEIESINLTTYETTAQAESDLQGGDLDITIEIPTEFEETILAASDQQSKLVIPTKYNESNLNTAQLAQTVVYNLFDEFSKQIRQYNSLFTITSSGVRSETVRYIDFLVPGILAMVIMSNNLNGVSNQIAAWRERGILRRLQGTLLKPSTFIGAQITSRLFMNGTQTLLVLLFAALIFSIQVKGSLLSLIFFIILGNLAFMAMAFIIAGVAKTPESVGPITAFLTLPMTFLGGIFFPINSAPWFLQPIVGFLPISHLTTAMRETMQYGTPFLELWPETLILLVWLVLGFTIASRVFKWE